MLAHIYSYCDTPTLAMLSLVSFGSWELAGPILYEHVEIVDLDGLAFLFFLVSQTRTTSARTHFEPTDLRLSVPYTQESPPPTSRLRDAVSPLSRIRSLSVEIKHWRQTTGPFFDTDPGPDDDVFEREDTDDIWGMIAPIAVYRPDRMYRHTRGAPLPLRELTLPHGGSSTVRRRNFLPTQVFPLLTPRTVIHLETGQPDWARFTSLFNSLAFLRDAWIDVERMVFDGVTFWHQNLDSEDYHVLPFAVLWAQAQQGQDKKLELVIELSSRGSFGYKDHLPGNVPGVSLMRRRTTLRSVVSNAGLRRQMLELVDLKVTVRVQAADEAIAKKDVDALEDWMKELVVVEAV